MRPERHGAAKKATLSIYRVLNSMKARCYQPNCDMYPVYGGRGVKICQEWLNDPASFVAWALVNGYKKGLSIDRIGHDGDYSPGNCRWVSMREQQNNRRNNRFATFKGETLTLAQWARKLGIQPYMLYSRLKYGWSFEEAVSAPKMWSKCEERPC